MQLPHGGCTYTLNALRVAQFIILSRHPLQPQIFDIATASLAWSVSNNVQVVEVDFEASDFDVCVSRIV